MSFKGFLYVSFCAFFCVTWALENKTFTLAFCVAGLAICYSSSCREYSKRLSNDSLVVVISLLFYCWAWVSSHNEAILANAWEMNISRLYSSTSELALQITPSNVLELRQVSKPCAEKSGVDVSIMSKVLDWTIPNDTPTKSFIYCLCIATGYTDTDGHLIINKMLTHKLLNGTQEEYIQELNECNKITRGSNIDTLFDIGTCIYDSFVMSIIN